MHVNPTDTYLRQETEAGVIGAPAPAGQPLDHDPAALRFIDGPDGKQPAEMFDRVVVEYAEASDRDPQDAAREWCLDRASRFLLVERNIRSDGRHHLSSHADSRAAGAYYLTQDCRDDWTVVELVDHKSGHRYTAEVRVLWNPVQTGPVTPPAS